MLCLLAAFAPFGADQGGIPCGDGCLRYVTGFWEGAVKGNKASGKGIFLLKSGDVYEGEMEEDAFQGKGVMKYSTTNGGGRYDGRWSADKPHGKGIFVDATSRYEGGWKEGKMHGKGLFSRDGFDFHGVWVDGEMVKNRTRQCSSNGKCLRLSSSPPLAHEAPRDLHMHAERLGHLWFQGFRPTGVVDIGAHEGEWSAMFLEIFSDCPSVLMLEANQDQESILKKRDIPYRIAMLGAENKEKMTYYATKDKYNTGNSMYKEQTAYFDDDNVEKRERPLFTLDAVLSDFKPDAKFNFLKLDVQGAELDVLKGASNALVNAEFVLLEIQTLEYNQGAPMFSAVIQQMSLYGFQVYDIFELHYLFSGHFNEMDLLFAKNTSTHILRPPFQMPGKGGEAEAAKEQSGSEFE
jgi:FkbM family methyltransferase